jgi:hypothetical protein
MKYNLEEYLTTESKQIHGLFKESFKKIKADPSTDQLK